MSQGYSMLSRALMVWMLLTTGFLIYWRTTHVAVQTTAVRPSNRVVWLQR